MLKDFFDKKQLLLKKLAFVFGIISTIIAFVFAVKWGYQNTLDYQNDHTIITVAAIKYLIGSYIVFALPGLILASFSDLHKIIGKTNTIFAIIPSSILYWILVSILYFNAFNRFDYLTVAAGGVLLLFGGLIGIITRKKFYPDFVQKNVSLIEFKKYLPYLFLFIPVLIALYTCFFAFFKYPNLPNWDAQTHAQIVGNSLQEHTLNIQDIFGNFTGYYKGQSFYPIGYHITIDIIGLVTGDFVPSLVRNVTTVFIALIPLITAGTVFSFTRKKLLALIAGFFSISFFWIPYKPLTWGGAPLMMSLVLGAYITAVNYFLIKKYQLKSSFANILIILSQLLLIIVHTSSFLAYLMLLGLLSYKHVISFFKKPQVKTLLLTAVASIVMIAALFLPAINTLKILYNAQVVEKTELVAKSVMEIHPTMFLKSLAIFEETWLSAANHILLFIFTIGVIYALTKARKSHLFRSLLAFFFILLATNALIAGTKNVPVVSQYTTIWFHNYQRLLYTMFLPVIFFISLAIYQFIREVAKTDFVKKLSYINKLMLIIVAFGMIYLANTFENANTIAKDVANHQPSTEVYDALNFLVKQNDPGVVIGFPSEYFNNEKDLDWINTYTTEFATYIDRGTHHIRLNERGYRAKMIMELESGQKDLCKLKKYKNTKYLDINYIYVSKAAYYPGDIRNNYIDTPERYDNINKLIQSSGCTELIYQSTNVSIYHFTN